MASRVPSQVLFSLSCPPQNVSSPGASAPFLLHLASKCHLRPDRSVSSMDPCVSRQPRCAASEGLPCSLLSSLWHSLCAWAALSLPQLPCQKRECHGMFPTPTRHQALSICLHSSLCPFSDVAFAQLGELLPFLLGSPTGNPVVGACETQ